MDLFWEKGYHATSMDDLANTLSLNRSSIYNSFGGKKDIFLKGLVQYQNMNFQLLQTLFSEISSVRVAFAKLFENTFCALNQDAKKRGCFLVNTSTEMAPADAEIQSFLKEHKIKIIQIFTDKIQEGIQVGELRSDLKAREVAEYLYTLYNGIGVISKLESTLERLPFTLEMVRFALPSQNVLANT